MTKDFKQKGFTLIEVLVVITIIGILASFLYSNFSSARQDAKNSSMQVELKEVKLALELYRAQNGSYPAAINSLLPDYIATLPSDSDSANSNCSLVYQTGPSNSYYKYTAERCHATDSTLNGVDDTDELARCPSSCSTCDGNALNNAYKNSVDFYETYAIYSLGGECD